MKSVCVCEPQVQRTLHLWAGLLHLIARWKLIWEVTIGDAANWRCKCGLLREVHRRRRADVLSGFMVFPLLRYPTVKLLDQLRSSA